MNSPLLLIPELTTALLIPQPIAALPIHELTAPLLIPQPIAALLIPELTTAVLIPQPIAALLIPELTKPSFGPAWPPLQPGQDLAVPPRPHPGAPLIGRRVCPG